MPFVQINVPVSLEPHAKEKLMRDVVERVHEAVGSDRAIINVAVGGHTDND